MSVLRHLVDNTTLQQAPCQEPQYLEMQPGYGHYSFGSFVLPLQQKEGCCSAMRYRASASPLITSPWRQRVPATSRAATGGTAAVAWRTTATIRSSPTAARKHRQPQLVSRKTPSDVAAAGVPAWGLLHTHAHHIICQCSHALVTHTHAPGQTHLPNQAATRRPACMIATVSAAVVQCAAPSPAFSCGCPCCGCAQSSRRSRPAMLPEPTGAATRCRCPRRHRQGQPSRPVPPHGPVPQI